MQKDTGDLWLDCFFALLKTSRIKPANKMLVKLTPIDRWSCQCPCWELRVRSQVTFLVSSNELIQISKYRVANNKFDCWLWSKKKIFCSKRVIFVWLFRDFLFKHSFLGIFELNCGNTRPILTILVKFVYQIWIKAKIRIPFRIFWSNYKFFEFKFEIRPSLVFRQLGTHSH